MGKKNNCTSSPSCNNDNGKLFEEILKVVGKQNRPMAEYIYVSYLVPGVATQMDALGKIRNKFSNHSGEDVCEFLEHSRIVTESNNIFSAQKLLGAVDSAGNIQDVTDPMEALKAVNDFNKNSKGLVAFLAKTNENSYRIIVKKRSNKTFNNIIRSKEAEEIWGKIRHIFTDKGLNLESFFNTKSSFINYTDPLETISYLSNLQNTAHRFLSHNDIKFLLSLNAIDPGVQRLISRYGSLESAVHNIYNRYHNSDFSNNLSNSTKNLMDTTVTRLQRFNGLYFSEILKDLKSTTISTVSSEEREQQNIIADLKKKAVIDVSYIEIFGKVDSVSQLVGDAIVSLQRQINKIEKELGVTPKVKHLTDTLKKLQNALNGERYHEGCLLFIKHALSQKTEIDDLISSMPTGNSMQDCKEQATSLLEIARILRGFTGILHTMCYLDTIDTEESLTDVDIKAIKQEASEIRDFYEHKLKTITQLRKEVVSNILINILGDTLYNGAAVANLVNMLEADGFVFDYLYSVARMSSPMVSAFGTIIRDAQDSRDAKFNEISRRIRVATRKLRKSGSNSKFMFEKNGYIISDINWDLYFRAKTGAYGKFRDLGLKGIELKEAMDNWEADNTEERVVDQKSGRTELVPNAYYRKDFPNLTPAQQQYYEEMMQIKGELGTILPKYAQKHYLAPQIRGDFFDLLRSSKNAKDITRACWKQIEDIWKIREDDDSFNSYSTLDGVEYGVSEAGIDNTPIRTIPIFYLNKLKDGRELLTDFSSTLQMFASTAINYEAMRDVQDLIELIQDHVDELPLQYSKDDVPQVQKLSFLGTKVIKGIDAVAGPTRTRTIMQSMLEQHLYHFTTRGPKWLLKFTKSVLSFISIKVLGANVFGAIGNENMGLLNLLIEAGGGEFFTKRDLAWAIVKFVGNHTLGAPSKIWDFFNYNKSSYDVLLLEKFDFLPGGINERSRKRYYHRNLFRLLVGSINPLILYAAGEYIVHSLTGLAILHNRKVRINGKKTYLYKAFIKTEDPKNPKLELRQGVTDLNGKPITEKDLSLLRGIMRDVNQESHGSMNLEDSGVVHQHILGKAIFNLRKWYVESMSRRWRSPHWSGASKMWRTGYKHDTLKMLFGKQSFLKGLIQDMHIYEYNNAVHWRDLSPHQKANFRKCWWGLFITGSLQLLSWSFDAPGESKKRWWYRMWMYQTRKALFEMASLDISLFSAYNAWKTWNTVIPSASQISAMFYPIFGIGDLWEERKIEHENESENKYIYNIQKDVIPFWKDINRLIWFDEDNTIFQQYDEDILHYSTR